MENSDVDESIAYELSYHIYPIDEVRPENAEVFYRECMKNHDGKIPAIHRSDREVMCDLYLCDVKIRGKLKKFISETHVKEKITNLFF
jgi:hypothetical protein